MGAGGFGGLGGMAALAGAQMGGVAQTYQSMMSNIQKLISYNPEFLRKGIPNNLLQMCMEQTKVPTMYGVSENASESDKQRHKFTYISLLNSSLSSQNLIFSFD